MGIMVFKSLAEALRAGFQVYDRDNRRVSAALPHGIRLGISAL